MLVVRIPKLSLLCILLGAVVAATFLWNLIAFNVCFCAFMIQKLPALKAGRRRKRRSFCSQPAPEDTAPTSPRQVSSHTQFCFTAGNQSSSRVAETCPILQNWHSQCATIYTFADQPTTCDISASSWRWMAWTNVTWLSWNLYGGLCQPEEIRAKRWGSNSKLMTYLKFIVQIIKLYY